MDIYFILHPAEIILLGFSVVVLVIQLYYYLTFYQAPYCFYKTVEKGLVKYSEEQPPVSVIVYAKNDADNLSRFLPDFLSQQYPDFEVIVVNDGSTDETKDVLSDFEYRYPNLYQTYIPEEARSLSRKKLAVTLGIKAAKHEIVILTCANCKPKDKNWLAAMVRNFIPGIDIVLGHAYIGNMSRYECFDRTMFTLRYLSFALRRKPYMGIGLNLAYRKSLFFANKGFSRYLNLHYGDDDLFINEIADSENTRVEISENSLIEVEYDLVHEAWKELKLRYDFTSKYLKSCYRSVFGFERITAYAFYLSVLALLIMGIYNLLFPLVGLVLFVIRYVFQWIIYNRSSKILGSRPSRLTLPFFDLVYTPVNIYYRLIGLFSRGKNYIWKRV